MRKCPFCGSPAAGNFCSSCGNPVPPAAQDEPGAGSVQDLYPVWDGDQSGHYQSGHYQSGYGHDDHDPGASGQPDLNQSGYLHTGHQGGQAQPVHGQDGQRRKGPGLGLGIVVGLVVVTLVAAGIALGMRFLGGDQPGADPSADSTRSSTQSTSTRGSSQSPETPEAKDPASMTAAEAETELEDLRAQSLAGASLDGRWILQLSSKYDGVNDPAQTALDGGHVFHLPDILAEHQQLRAQFEPGVPVLLLKSSDFGSSSSDKQDRTWVTLADPGSMSSKSEAQSRCAELFPGRTGHALENVCLPRQFKPPS